MMRGKLQYIVRELENINTMIWGIGKKVHSKGIGKHQHNDMGNRKEAQEEVGFLVETCCFEEVFLTF